MDNITDSLPITTTTYRPATLDELNAQIAPAFAAMLERMRQQVTENLFLSLLADLSSVAYPQRSHMPHGSKKTSPNMQTTTATKNSKPVSKKTPTATTSKPISKKKRGYLNSIYLGSAQEIYELQRHATVSGAGTVSSLVRSWNNNAKRMYNDRLTILEQEIIRQTEEGNNELPGLVTELRAHVNDNLRADFLQFALASLVRRGFLICVLRGGKTNVARGAKTKCFFPKGHKLGSDFTLATLSNNYEGSDDE